MGEDQRDPQRSGGVVLMTRIMLKIELRTNMSKPDYCSRPSVESCIECSLTNYRKDCMNNPIQESEDE